MLHCDFCHSAPAPQLTRCCRALLCPACKDRNEKKQLCPCGKPFPTKKSCTDCPEVLELLRRFSEGRQRECDRCDGEAELECLQCEMVFCSTCNSEVHAGVGFARHERKKYQSGRQSLDKMRRKEAVCGVHGQLVVTGCECGTGLCSSCLKSHKEGCSKGGKTKPLKEFKQEYYLSALLKMRQVSDYKEKLGADRLKYLDHFKQQQAAFESAQKLIGEQFEYLTKMIEIKYGEARTRLGQYWSNCEKVHQQTLRNISQQLKKYDQYGELLQKFAENMTNLDYFERRIRRHQVPFEFVNVRVLNVDLAQSALMGISLAEKQWETPSSESQHSQATQSRGNIREEGRLFGGLQNASEQLLDCTHNPLRDRQLHLLPSHCEIYFSFIHLPYQNLRYELEYGLGMKMKGQQVFKRISNATGYGTIEGLNPSTRYRVRMRVGEGQWGAVSQISTLDPPKLNLQSSPFAKALGESIQLIKGGAIYGSNEIHFGVHRWVVKLTSKSISYQQSETACMSIGVSNKQTKKATFVGTTLNYGYQKSEIVLRILLDCNEKRMVISSSISNTQEVYQNLPPFPLFPTVQNKGNGQVHLRYNLTTDDPASC